MEKKIIEYKRELKTLNEESKVNITLRKLYELNRKDLHRTNDNLIKLVANEDLIMSSYDKLKKNKGSSTPGVDFETPDGFNLEKAFQLSQDIIHNRFVWSDIKRVMIPKPGKKKERPLGIPTFRDKLIQENIRIVLNVIYEPLFQQEEFNHGFRPRRSPETALTKLQRDSKELTYALEGDIKGAFDNVDHKILINILKKKISDKKFLSLIKSGLEHNIVFKGTKAKNLLGTPQGGIASPILFNIYMHEFDLHVRSLVNKYEDMNSVEGRSSSGKMTRYARKISSRIEKAKSRIEKKFKTYEKLTPDMLAEIQKTRIIMRKNKSTLLHSPSKRRDSMLIRFAYSRYADDWILLTNLKLEFIEETKVNIMNWLQTNLKLELDEHKTLITNLEKDKAKFLGFTIFKKKKRIIRKLTSKGLIFRQRSTVPLTIGIDHERIRNRLEFGKLLNSNLSPRSNPHYTLLKPVPMIQKYRQRLDGLYNYYYRILTYSTELNYYYYVHKFSLLKTLARRMDKSIKQITLTYGEEIKIETTYKQTTLKGISTKTTFAKFPTYKEITLIHSQRSELKDKKMFARMKKLNTKEYLDEIVFEDLTNLNWIVDDPFTMNSISINLRSQYQLKTHCSVCGCEPSLGNAIEMHHLKHVKKDKVSGFNQVMKNLNRKTIPVCKSCHKKIHKGTYDGHTLKDVYDVDLTQI